MRDVVKERVMLFPNKESETIDAMVEANLWLEKQRNIDVKFIGCSGPNEYGRSQCWVYYKEK